MLAENLRHADAMLELTEEVHALCEPLFSLGPISLVTYTIFTPNAGFKHVSTRRSIYERKLARDSWFEDVFRFFDHHVHFSGFQIGDLVSGFREDYEPYLLQLAREDVGQVAGYGELKEDGTYHLVLLAGAAERRLETLRFQQNNAHIIRFFCRKLAPTMTALSQPLRGYALSDQMQQAVAHRLRGLEPAELDLADLLKALGTEQHLTLRQSQIVYWYLMGKTSEETATILGVTKNTIETHWKRIKRKFDCLRKPQVLSELLRYGSYLPRSL